MNMFGRTALSCFLLFLAQQIFAQQGKLKSPDEFLPHKLGEKFTAHHQLTAYFDYLAASAPQTLRIEQYGVTNEERPLRLVYLSSPENMARLEQIRLNNLRIAGAEPGQPDMSNPVAVVWLSMSVHGNEASGSECSMELAYRLASQTDPQIKEWLKNTLVILDPSLNPDGYDRYTHWNRGVSNRVKNVNPDSREHREPWPGGRVNHYYFDLNRDWAWATQVETRQRIAVYQRWLPQVHADLHEQGVDNPYYFAPAAEPMHDYITSWQREFQTRIGENHAHYFDQNGWLYFTKEVFDLFYPSYGDTYPMFNGAIGMTYEQAGNSSGGTAVTMSNGDTLTLHDRILHHLTTSLSTIEISSKNAAKVVQNFRDYYAKTSTQPQGQYKAFVIPESNDANKINTLCALLDLHKIRYGRAGAGLSGVKVFDYRSGKETTVSIQPNDVVISAYQLKSTLVQVLFEPESRLSDSMTYDITAWSLPYAHGLNAYALKDRLEPKKAFEPVKAPNVMLAASPYSWCIHRKSLAESVFLSEILQKGVKVRYATKPFAIADQQFAEGALVINRGDNRVLAGELDGIVKTAAANGNVTLFPIFTGYGNKGNDLGSEAFQLIKTPEVAIVYGEDVDNNNYGHTWYFFEQELKYPVTPISVDRLSKADLYRITTLIFPNGRYHLTDPQMAQLQDWVRQGGRIIASEGGVKIFADKEGFGLKTKETPKKDSTSTPLPFSARERAGVSEQMPGAVIKSRADPSDPLAYGMGDVYFTLKTNSEMYEVLSDKAAPAIYIEDNYQSYGFIGSKLKPRLKKTPVAVSQRLGDGSIVYLIDDPLFRCFWQQGKVLFANALFF